jgi:signal recognition particle receptor subunit beta
VVQINFAKREINCKLVYYGPGLSGKTTNLEVVHKKAPASKKGELTSIATEGDRTLFFDYMPLELGKVGGMNTKFQLYTVPGQVYYNATRKLVLQGADGVVFVADSQPDKMEENLESLQNLDDNLKEQGLDMRSIPLVLQWNKRDLPNVLPCEELDKKMNKFGAPTFEAVAVTGEGVFPTLRKLAQMVLEKLNKEYGLQTEKPAGEEGAAGGAKAKAPGATTSGTMPKPPAPPAAPKEGGAPKAPASAPPAAAKPASSPAMAKPPEPAKKPEPVATKEPPKKAEPPAPPAKKPEPVVAKAPAPAPEAAKAPDRSHKDQPNNWDRPITGMTKPVEPAKGGKGLLIAAILLVVLIGGGVGAYFFVPQFKEIVDQKTGLGGSK